MSLGNRIEQDGDVVPLGPRGVLPPARDESVDGELDGDEDGKRQEEQPSTGQPARIGEENEQNRDDADEGEIAAEWPPGAALIEAAKDVRGVNCGEGGGVRVLEGFTLPYDRRHITADGRARVARHAVARRSCGGGSCHSTRIGGRAGFLQPCGARGDRSRRR
jgi:hypothetical protein